MTLEEYLELPQAKPYLEFVDGEVVEKMSPQAQHSRIQGALLAMFGSLKPYGYEALSELHSLFGRPARGYIPDVVIVATSRLQRDERGRVFGPINFAPEIAIEILSPDDRAGRVLEKLTFYMDNGVQLALVIDPDIERVSVYRPGQAPLLFPRSATIDLSPVIPDFSMELEKVFGALEE